MSDIKKARDHLVALGIDLVKCGRKEHAEHILFILKTMLRP